MRRFPSGGPQHRIPKIVHAAPRAERRGGPVTLKPEHPAIREARTLFPSTVVSAANSPRLLVEGRNSRKVGSRVTKGAWKGMPIFTLTLEERATCPSTCEQWHACYGNNMHMARRHRLDINLITRLFREIAEKSMQHPDGFVVRAHILGDFGSPDNEELALRYVDMWRYAFSRFSALRMFTYTAHAPYTDIGMAIRQLNIEFPDRCRIRFSGHELGGEGAVVIDSLAESRHVVCPAQTDQTDCCATCALCWSMDYTVEFLRH